jgi:predicted neutral ceramidase superfamily lipid hydrolase
MALLNNICTPALIYLIFALSQIIIDTYKRAYNIAFVKFIQMVVFTLMLNLLCARNLTWISWLIIAVPFLFMGFMSILLLYVLKLDGRSSEVIEEDEKGETEPSAESKNEDINGKPSNNENVVYVRSNQKVVVDDSHFWNNVANEASNSSQYA